MDSDVKAAYRRRLKLLQIRAALRGIDTPPEVLIEIEDIERVIKKRVQEVLQKAVQKSLSRFAFSNYG